MFCFVEQLCIPDCGEVAKKAEAEAVFKELLASCTSRLARTTLGVRPHEEALFDIIRGSIMNLYKRDYIKSVPTKQEMQLYEGILCTERKAVGDRGFGKINHRRLIQQQFDTMIVCSLTIILSCLISRTKVIWNN